MSSSQGSLILSTSRYKNKMALSAWLWVEAETLRSTANMVKNASTSRAPCRADGASRPSPHPCAQCTYVVSVLKL